MTTVPGDLSGAVTTLSKRIYKLEQRLTSPDYAVPNGSSPTFANITVTGDDTAEPVLVTATPDPATGLALTTTSNFDDIFITAQWSAPADGSASGYELFWFLQSQTDPNHWDMVNSAQTSGTSRTVSNLLPGRTYGFQVRSISAVGALGPPLPAVGYTSIVAAHDATVPTNIGGLIAVGGPSSITMLWNDSTDPDLSHYRVQVSTNTAFTAIVHDETSTASIVAFTDLIANTTYYVRVRAVDTSGNEGNWTAYATVVAAYVDGNMIAPNSIGTNHVVIPGLDAATIKFGTMTGDRIKVNTLDVKALTTSTMTARTITLDVDGIIRGLNSGGNTGWSLNQDGFKIYDIFGNPTVTLNRDGSASFKGTIVAGSTIATTISADKISGGTISGITVEGGTVTGATVQTAYTGFRVVIPSSYSVPAILMYSGQPGETNPGQIFVGTASDLHIASPDSGGSGQKQIVIDSSGTYVDAPLYEGSNRVFSAGNPPSYPVSSVQGRTGAVSLTASDVGALPSGTAYVSSVNGLSGAVTGLASSSHSHSAVDAFGGTGYGMALGEDGTNVRIYYNGTAGFRVTNGKQLSCNITGSADKSFIIDHPTPDKADEHYLHHSAIEGPTADVFYRGEARLTFFQDPDWDSDLHFPRPTAGHGAATVMLPDYFEDLVRPEGRTVSVTPILGCDDADCPFGYGDGDIADMVAPSLAVTRVANGRFFVRTTAGFNHSCASFFWEVKGVRKDVPLYDPEPKKEDYIVRGDGPYTYLTPA
jgi:hypothetical protein